MHVSHYCGYQNRSHFSAVFKKEFGITASAFRRRQLPFPTPAPASPSPILSTH
jgi:AraC-like DNA-binding protein